MNLFRLSTWALRRRVLALCLTVGVILSALGIYAAVIANQSNTYVDDLLNRTGPMRVAGENLVTAYVDQETAVRGYAISGRPENLDPYNEGVKNANQLIATIRGQLRPQEDDDDVRAALAEVVQRADAWRAGVADPVISAVQTRGVAASQVLIDQAGTRLFDDLRASIGTLQADILILRNVVADAARQTGSRLVAVEIAVAAIIILAGASLLLLLDRLVTRPVVELAEQVREVAAGDYDKHIYSAGSPELRVLAEDVDGMRKQIAAELAEVREARSQIEWVNDQLKVQAEELVRSNRDLEQFAYVASHDLQEPLRKVASFCQLLQRRYAGQMDERADQYIGFAVDGAQRMQRLINDLLAFSRIGRLTSGFTDVDLDRVLADVKSQLETAAGDDAEIVWTDLPVVEGEEPLLTTLFVNLIGNSLKFRRPDVPPRIEVSAGRDGDEWRITVRDNGIGIEREFADKVFVIFQRLHARDAYEGTGIGLAIVKKIVEYHGGRIWLDLDVDEGTSINFTLPVPAVLVAAEEPRKEVTA
ncbi:ATP-binding protein [Actinoplanes sp. NBRC 103695]|uniref:sensor histidine kinase n=1 Tax=Actinoplanes sp. NBRC 103695 TaxID=3032202 RepID=UPI0024A54A77|nr:ATP-binding protein [Actinoplanes sp. NBRC 103695]GLY96211.1 histidine kinase [Actinoplanes sp. NBRC 103695]